MNHLFVENRPDGSLRLAVEHPPGKISLIIEIDEINVAGFQVALIPPRAYFGPVRVPVVVKEVDAELFDKGDHTGSST